MTANTTIARPYAKAVFEQAREEGNLDGWSSLLKTLANIVREPKMRLILSNPKISPAKMLELVSSVYGGKLSASATNFIRVLIRSNRLRLAGQISELFEQKRAEAEGRIEVNVVSAYELDADQTRRIADVMGKRTGRKVNVSSVVDPSLIGGVIIRAGDSVIDASLRGRLNRLRNELIG